MQTSIPMALQTSWFYLDTLTVDLCFILFFVVWATNNMFGKLNGNKKKKKTFDFYSLIKFYLLYYNLINSFLFHIHHHSPCSPVTPQLGKKSDRTAFRVPQNIN